MKELLTPRPERAMPPGHHELRRRELLEAIEEEAERPRRRSATPLLAAAAVIAVVGGLGVGVPALRDDAQTPVSGSGTQDSATRAPAVRTLSAAEQASFLQECTKAVNKVPTSTQNWYTGFQVTDGFEFTEVTDPGQTKAWLVTHFGPRGLLCGRNAAGTISDAVITPWLAAEKRGASAQVTPLARNAGLVTSRTARVTRQAGDGPEVGATLRDGFWFTPTPGQDKLFDRPDGLSRLLPGETIRGYDAGDKLIYNSATQPPTGEICYSEHVATNQGPRMCFPTYTRPK